MSTTMGQSMVIWFLNTMIYLTNSFHCNKAICLWQIALLQRKKLKHFFKKKFDIKHVFDKRIDNSEHHMFKFKLMFKFIIVDNYTKLLLYRNKSISQNSI